MPFAQAPPLAAAVLALTALTACGKHDAGDGTGKASGPVDAGKVLAIAAANAHPRAGRWQATITINHIDMPGMSPQLRDAMQHGLAGRAPLATCLTPEQAARPAGEFFSGRHHDCVYDRFTMADGKLDAVMHCSGPSTHMKMTMTGTYDETSYTIHSTSMSDMPGGQTMAQDMNVAAQWVGACTGSEVNSAPKP